MKIKLLAAALIAAAASPSFALVPGSEGNSNPILHVYGSGATAVDKQVKELVKTICRPGTLDIFTDDVTRPQGSRYAAFYCVVGPAEIPGLSQDTNLMIHKNSNGGSFNGVGPVADNAIEDQMVIQTGVGFCGAAPAGNDAGTPVWACNRNQVDNTKNVDFGISDIEPGIWARLGRSFTAANLVTTAMNGNTFGIPVTLALRNALQTAQGLPSGSDLAADQPNLSRAQVSSLLQGNITNWDQFRFNGFPLPSQALVAPVNKRVQICRRVATSGTQAQADVFFNSNPCGNGTANSLGDNTSFSSPANGSQASANLNPLPATRAVVHEHDGSSGVVNCLNALQDANAWAIGISSLENSSAKMRFVRIDGALPTLKNVANNTYGDWYTATIQWRTAAAPNAPTGDKLRVLQLIRDDAASPAILAQINASFSQPGMGAGAGEVGLVALPYKPSATNKVFSVANPVATASREGATGTLSPNSCKTPVVFGNAEVTKAD
jgi:ABC-type phosphate transport system substrate-binding protein